MDIADFFITETIAPATPAAAPAPAAPAAPKVEQLCLIEATPARTTRGRKVTRVLYTEPELF